jgi:hypothetical protein
MNTAAATVLDEWLADWSAMTSGIELTDAQHARASTALMRMCSVDEAWQLTSGRTLRSDVARRQARRKDLSLLLIELTGRAA